MARQKTYPHELIGKKVKVVTSSNNANLGITGTLVDETKNTFVIETDKGLKTILKNNITIVLCETGTQIAGRDISKRPEDRVKG
ncbi:hypothetical protein COV17_02675 [Candidatus Woesearchaeota archaeon CG10_big_fil_rev_8_21_14_0_10_36_11]|nr:MAG: hypothetical protein COV17_02675 [Candidatus Woesearchaeota archaeon CG10_big_fil_rev_8_21_14_0_10_36_11]